MKLAALCSQAVDYSKNGKPVDLQGNLPKTARASIPDWHKTEAAGATQNPTDYNYYKSDRALGHLYREIALCDAKEPLKGFIVTSPRPAPLEDAISRSLAPLVRCFVVGRSGAAVRVNGQVEMLYRHYAQEMQYICTNHTLVSASQAGCQSHSLTEEEIVLGTILATSTQPRLRQSRAARMKLNVETLVGNMRSHIVGTSRNKGPVPGLRDAWTTWCWAQHHQGEGEFVYIESFALIALGVILDCLKQLGALPDN
jgi:RNA-dependent RNA polymerase